MPKGFHGNVIIINPNLKHSTLLPDNSYVIEGPIMLNCINLLLDMSTYGINVGSQFITQQIIHKVNHLLLVLAHAGQHICVHCCSDDYLMMFLKTKAKFILQDYSLSVAMTIQMSLDHLP
jgi:hypothetical protein